MFYVREVNNNFELGYKIGNEISRRIRYKFNL